MERLVVVSFKQNRRYVAHGRMPQKRTGNSGLYSINVKEDGYFIDFTEHALIMREGARTSRDLELPYYYINKAYFNTKRMIESVGFSDEGEHLELYVQYARLPFLDPRSLESLQKEVITRMEKAQVELVEKRDQQAMYDLMLYELCDQPITYLNYSPETRRFQVKARAPFPPIISSTNNTQKKLQANFKDYEDQLCSQAALYLVKAAEMLPGIDTLEVVLVRMDYEPVVGVSLAPVDTHTRPSGLRKFGLRENSTPFETEKDRKKREKEEKKLEKQRKKQNPGEFAMNQREPSDELFDGTLSYESVLLSAQVPRQEFANLIRSKVSYSARNALEQFELRLNGDENEGTFAPVEPFFVVS